MRRVTLFLVALSLAAAACSDSGDQADTSGVATSQVTTTTLAPVETRDFSEPYDPAALACGADRAEAQAVEQAQEEDDERQKDAQRAEHVVQGDQYYRADDGHLE